MTPEEFRQSLRTLGLTSRGFSALTGIHHGTICAWGKDYGHPLPEWVSLLLTAWSINPETIPKTYQGGA